jgi:hypothetical protein
MQSIWPANNGPPFRQKDRQNTEFCGFSREIDPPPPFLLARGGGWQSEKMLDVCALLAFRQFPALAEGPAQARQKIAEESDPFERRLPCGRYGNNPEAVFPGS